MVAEDCDLPTDSRPKKELTLDRRILMAFSLTGLVVTLSLVGTGFVLCFIVVVVDVVVVNSVLADRRL